MSTVQDEIRTCVVVEYAFSPRVIRMTVRAIGSAVPFMMIIFEVTADAVHLHDVFPRVLAVTVVASQLRMFTFEWKVRVAGVVEARVRPVTRIVAVFALFSAATFV